MAFAFTYYYLSGKHWLATSLFLLASITDMVDGFIARKYDLITDLGKLLDPLADKVLTLLALFVLMYTQKIPAFIFYFMLGKELIFVTVGVFNLRKNIVVYSKFFGKLTTVLFFCGIMLLLVDFTMVGNILLYIALVCAIIAAIQYFFAFINTNEV